VREPRFLRFSGFQRTMHWLIAVPYMVLLGTGALILLRHLGWVKTPGSSLLSTLHRWVGLSFTVIVFELLLAAIVAGHWKMIGRDFLDWLIPRPRDLRWLMIVPLNTFFPRRFPLPPAGRFNAGQKLHGLFILVAVSGFIVTGILMMLVRGWLEIWLIHTWLFFGATAFFGLHLFLALINPATRRALSGVFTGHVSHVYVSEHHALVLKEVPAGHAPHAAVSIKAMVMALLPVAAALLVWWHGPGRNLVPAVMAPSQANAMISPGTLVSAHSSLVHANHCAACHTDSGPTTKAACLVCHLDIGKALDQKSGYHGKLGGDCGACHIEHRGSDADLRNFDTRTFNHQLARFTVRGAHESLSCNQCHVRHSPTPGTRRYIGVRFTTCADCHANPHADMPAANCAQCHSERNWTGHDLLFTHDRDTHFKLDATHSVLSCGSCHQKAGTTLVFRGTPTTCERCHVQITDAMAGKIGILDTKADPHSGRISCVECHAAAVRSPTPAQYAAQCERCHGVRYRTLFFNWQKSLDEREQAARLRLQRQSGQDPQAIQREARLLDQAHSAGIHNVQEAIEAFDQIGK
jgi:formate dehydrogenase gamma subunit